jgi:hypothetical protein
MKQDHSLLGELALTASLERLDVSAIASCALCLIAKLDVTQAS